MLSLVSDENFNSDIIQSRITILEPDLEALIGKALAEVGIMHDLLQLLVQHLKVALPAYVRITVRKE